MRHLTAALITIATCLWLGGLITLVLAAISVFRYSGLDQATAGRAANAIFRVFAKAQLIFAALTLIPVFLAYLQTRSRLSIILFTLFAIATVGAAIFSGYFIPQMEELRQTELTRSAAFQKLHKQSEHLLTAVTLVVLIAATLLPTFCRNLLTTPSKPE